VDNMHELRGIVWTHYSASSYDINWQGLSRGAVKLANHVIRVELCDLRRRTWLSAAENMLTRCGLQKTWFLWLDGANVSVLCKHSRGTLEDRSKVLFMYSSIRPLKTIFEWFYMIYFVTW